MINEKIKSIKQQAYDDMQKDKMQVQSNNLNELDYMLYLQFWLMYYENKNKNVDTLKLKDIAGRFEKAYIGANLNIKRVEKAKDLFFKMSKGEKIDMVAENCGDFTADDWLKIGESLNNYFAAAQEIL